MIAAGAAASRAFAFLFGDPFEEIAWLHVQRGTEAV